MDTMALMLARVYLMWALWMITGGEIMLEQDFAHNCYFWKRLFKYWLTHWLICGFGALGSMNEENYHFIIFFKSINLGNMLGCLMTQHLAQCVILNMKYDSFVTIS